MLNRQQLETLLEKLDKEVVNRRSLGGYSPDANTLLFLCEVQREVIRDRLERTPMPKKKKTEEEEA